MMIRLGGASGGNVAGTSVDVGCGRRHLYGALVALDAVDAGAHRAVASIRLVAPCLNGMGTAIGRVAG